MKHLPILGFPAMAPPHLRLLTERTSDFIDAWADFAQPWDAAVALRSAGVDLDEAARRLEIDVASGIADLARRLPIGNGCNAPYRRATGAVRGQLAAAAAYRACDQRLDRVGEFLAQALEAFAGESLPEPARLLETGTTIPERGKPLDTILQDVAAAHLDCPSLAAGICAVRDVLAFLALDDEYRYRPVRVRGRVPVLAVSEAGQDQDWVGWLRIEVLDRGHGVVYPDPVRFGPVLMDDVFRNTPSLARDVANAVRLPDVSADAFDLRQCDIRWSLETHSLPRREDVYLDREYLIPLAGGSLGAAFAVNLARMRFWLPAEEHIALTGDVKQDGAIEWVGGVARKVRAALKEREALSGCRVVTRVIVPVANEDEARRGAAEAGYQNESLALAVATARNVEEGLARVRTYRLDADRLRTRDYMVCATRVADFLDYYRFEKNRRPAPFGGRDDELAQLRSHILQSDSAARYTLLAGPAGMGKSALLVKLLDELTDTLPEGWSIVYVPISSRFTTNGPNDVFAMLRWQLSRVHGPEQTPNSTRWNKNH
jgi:hypothetical protein